jgi:hypothetical protein
VGFDEAKYKINTSWRIWHFTHGIMIGLQRYVAVEISIHEKREQ